MCLFYITKFYKAHTPKASEIKYAHKYNIITFFQIGVDAPGRKRRVILRIIARFLAAAFVSVAMFVGAGSTVHAQTENTNNQEETKKVEVKPGDSLSKIAKKNETTYIRLFNANDFIEDPNLIFPGDLIRIPDQDEKLDARSLPSSSQTATVERANARRTSEPSSNRGSSRRSTSRQTPQPADASINGGVWDRLAQCESSGNWSINTGNGYYGGLQFTLSSWRAVGGSGYPHHASKAEQIKRAEKLQALQGWGAWPACTAKLGIR